MAGSWLIGSDSACDLVVDHQAVSARHCRLTSVGNASYLLEDVGSTNGTYVDGQRIAAPVRVSRDNAVTLGRLQPMPWPDDLRADPAPRTSTVVRIGREPDNDLVVNLPTVSGYHARVAWGGRPGEAEIEDLGSANGTAVGSPDRRVARAVVTANDTIYLGTYPLPAARVFEALGTPPGELSVGLEPVVIGRDAGCDRVVDRAFVSGRHARLIRRNDGSVVVEDLGSANGTYVNGFRIDRVGTARPGDTIRVGNCDFVLAVEPVVGSPPAGTIQIELDRETVTRAVPSSGPLGSVVAEEWRAAWSPAWKPALFLALGPLAGVLAVGSAGFDVRSLRHPAEWAGAGQSLAALLSRLGLAAVGLGLVIGAGTAPAADLRRWLVRALASAALCLAVCLLEWGTFRVLSGAGAGGAAVLGLLWLGSGAGLMLGRIVGAVAPRPAAAWVAVALLAIPLWALGGESTSWVRLPGWAKGAAGFNPSRWTFEGLLLIASERAPAPAGTGAVGDLAEPYFPAETDRTGPLAVTLALGAMLVGWGAVAAFIAAETPPPSPVGRPAT